MGSPIAMQDPDTLAVNTIRGLCMDAVQKANSGHPGHSHGMAPVAYTLWQQFLRFDPADPIWPNRDRFVLSEGHASTLLWSLLHLSQVQAVDPDYEVRAGLRSRSTTSRPSASSTRTAPGIPSTAGRAGSRPRPDRSGQGVATSVGMAIAGHGWPRVTTETASRSSISTSTPWPGTVA